jgi:hypothetical protein
MLPFLEFLISRWPALLDVGTHPHLDAGNSHNGRRADERLFTEFRSEREYPNNGRPERVAAERDDLATPSICRS